MKKYFILLASIILAFISSCKDNDPKTTPTPIPVEVEDEWPDFVDTGANLVAYKVDGKIRVTKNISKLDSTKGYLSCGYSLHDKYKYFFFIGNRISDDTFESVGIFIGDLKDTGLFILGGTSLLFNGGSYSSGTNENNAKQYATSKLDSGYIIVTKIDTIKGVITGRFEFTGQYVFGSQKKKITDGRFDLKYYR